MNLNIKSLRAVKFNNLIKLGYAKPEATWITNFANQVVLTKKPIDLDNINIESDGHTNNTHTYTKTIITSIGNSNYQDWAKYSAHINYDIIFKYFYVCGFPYLAHGLLKYKFSNPNEFAILQQFNKKNKCDIDKQDLSKLLRIIESNNWKVIKK